MKLLNTIILREPINPSLKIGKFKEGLNTKWLDVIIKNINTWFEGWNNIYLYSRSAMEKEINYRNKTNNDFVFKSFSKDDWRIYGYENFKWLAWMGWYTRRNYFWIFWASDFTPSKNLDYKDSKDFYVEWFHLCKSYRLSQWDIQDIKNEVSFKERLVKEI